MSSFDAVQIKTDVDLLQLVQRDTQLKRLASTGGGEWAGACPRCGGDDRFRVQLNRPATKRPSGAAWMCRQCHPRWGDVIGYVQEIHGLEFQDALQWLAEYANLPPQEKNQLVAEQRAGDHHEQASDRDLVSAWVEACGVFIDACVNNLWAEIGTRALAYLRSRGIRDEVLQAWEIGFNPESRYTDPAQWASPTGESIWVPKGIVIPCQDAAGLHYVKIRQATGKPRYLMLAGSHMWLYGVPTMRDAFTVFLFESELDVLLAISTGFTGCGYASIPAGQPMRREYAPVFETVEDVIVCMDNDDEGQKAAGKLCMLDSFTRGELLPMGKDLTEYHQGGGDVFEYLYGQLERLRA